MSPFTRMLGSRIAKGWRPTNTSSRKPANANSSTREATSCPDRVPRRVIPSLPMNHGILLICATADRRDLSESARELAQRPHAAIRIEREDGEQQRVQQDGRNDAGGLAEHVAEMGAVFQEYAHVGIPGAIGAVERPAQIGARGWHET